MKKFLKSRWFFLPHLIVLLLFFYITKNVDGCIVLGILFMSSAIDDYKKYKKRQSYLTDLQQNGLTEEVAEQNAFVQQWGLIVKKGVIYYCLIYNGLPLTICFTVFFGFLIFIVDINLQAKIDLQGGFIISAIAGFILGIISSRFLWSVNQKKFALLTNSSH